MSHEYIIAEQRGRVGIITFNRPDRLNAMIPEMELRSAASWRPGRPMIRWER